MLKKNDNGQRPGITRLPVFRVGLLLVLVLAAFALVQQMSVPKSFGEYGYYRGDNVDEWAGMPVSYADETKTCASCHAERYQTLKQAVHGQLSCETCHGAALQHTEDPGAVQPVIEPSREFCGSCHQQIEGRSENNIKQIDLEQHNTGINCVQCHDPHDPWAMFGGGKK